MRLTQPRKPLRAYLLVGDSDNESPLGNWCEVTKGLATALEYAGYDHVLRVGEGAGHTLRFQAHLLTECLLWLFSPGQKARL